MEYLEKLLENSNEKKATDLHLCPGSRPLFRINGKLVEKENSDYIKPQYINSIIEELVSEEGRDTLFSEKVLDFSFSKQGIGRFRTNIYSQRGTFAMAIRMLPFEIPKLSELGLPPIVETFTAKTKGLYLATGSTGSGKSTTLASLLDLINERYNYHILTIEDPIEYLHKHKKSLVTQREIGYDAKSFSQALRSALREDPDVIMVGEMRDPETIQIALTAAETGHLVFSTLHTVGAAKSIDRIVDAFPANSHNQIRTQLATVLEGVISQQLIPRKDCAGMVLASEVMVTNSAIKNLIREGKHYQINSVIQTGQAQGMQLLESDLARLASAGLIEESDAAYLALDQKILAQFLNRR